MPIMQVRVERTDGFGDGVFDHEIAISHDLTFEEYELIAHGVLFDNSWCKDDIEISWIVLDGDKILGMSLAEGEADKEFVLDSIDLSWAEEGSDL